MISCIMPELTKINSYTIFIAIDEQNTADIAQHSSLRLQFVHSVRVVHWTYFQLGSWKSKELLTEFVNKDRLMVTNNGSKHAIKFNDVL